jgi:hypothetical protein
MVGSRLCIIENGFLPQHRLYIMIFNPSLTYNSECVDII